MMAKRKTLTKETKELLAKIHAEHSGLLSKEKAGLSMKALQDILGEVIKEDKALAARVDTQKRLADRQAMESLLQKNKVHKWHTRPDPPTTSNTMRCDQPWRDNNDLTDRGTPVLWRWREGCHCSGGTLDHSAPFEYGVFSGGSKRQAAPLEEDCCRYDLAWIPIPGVPMKQSMIPDADYDAIVDHIMRSSRPMSIC